MKTSLHGAIKIKQREGCLLHAYRDIRGIWTVGVGHSSEAGTPPTVYPGMRITMAQALGILQGDLAPREVVMNELLKRPATQNQFDAMMSLMFNIGDTGFKDSDVLRLFNEGDMQAAANAFSHWSHPADLAQRRAEERQQFLTA